MTPLCLCVPSIVLASLHEQEQSGGIMMRKLSHDTLSTSKLWNAGIECWPAEQC